MLGRLARAPLYAHALRRMRARQIAARARRLVPPRLLAAGLRPGPPPAWSPLARGLAVDAAPQSGPTPAPDQTGVFAAVGESRDFADAPVFWQQGSSTLLFTFELHGFAALAAYAAAEPTPGGDAFWQRVLASWLAHAARPDAVGWHPFPLSARVTAWIAALSRGGWPPALEREMLASLWQQARFLRRCVEHDIGGNHVVRNGVALTYAGVCLGSPGLTDRALALLRRELADQVLADGGHEERSTSYQRALAAELGDVVELLARAGLDAPPWLRETTARMTRWLDELTGPDGRLPLLNDAWEGPARPRATAPRSVLAASGHVVLRHGGDQLVVDAGPLAPAHLPPHAHADALSFVLWSDGAPLVVDPGTGAYTGPARQRFRATAAHNTVEVDGQDQCVFWGDFRAALMPRVELATVEDRDSAVVIRAWHDGYARLADPVIHERLVCWLPGDGIVVLDRLTARREHVARTRLHLAPGVALRDGRIGPLALEALGDGPPVATQTAAYSPFLGREVAIEVAERAGPVAPGAPFGWALLRPPAAAQLQDGALVIRRPGRADLRIDGPVDAYPRRADRP